MSLADVLPRLTALTALDLSDNAVGDEGASHLFPALRGRILPTGGPHPPLQVLCLTHASFGVEGARALASVLPSLRNLRELDVEGAMWGGSVTLLTPCLKHLTALSTLKISRNRFIPANDIILLHDSDDDNQAGDGGATPIIEYSAIDLLLSIAQLTGLQRMEMAGCCQQGLVPMEALAACLAELTSLTHLDLSSSDLDDNAMVPLIEGGLKHLSGLRHLDLSCNPIGALGWSALGLSVFPRLGARLESLSMAETLLADALEAVEVTAGAEEVDLPSAAFLQGLQYCTGLKSLNLVRVIETLCVYGKH